MLRSIEAIVDKNGKILPLEQVDVPAGTHAIVTFFSPLSEPTNVDTALLSEGSLTDWNDPAEEQAWQYLQKEK